LPEKLAHYGEGAHISNLCSGKTVDYFYKDGQWLLIRFTDGHEARIGWQDAAGNQLKGEPFLENLDVRIQLVGASAAASGGKVG